MKPQIEQEETTEFYEKPEEIKYILYVEVDGHGVYKRETTSIETIIKGVYTGSEAANNYINEEVTPWTLEPF